MKLLKEPERLNRDMGKSITKGCTAFPGCELYIYEGLSHGLYEEAPDFIDRVRDFCL